MLLGLASRVHLICDEGVILRFRFHVRSHGHQDYEYQRQSQPLFFRDKYVNKRV